MRILSQDGMIDVPYEQVGVSINHKNKTDIVAYPAGNYVCGSHWIMAEYSSTQKAQNAMEMLHKEWENFGESGLFRFPQDDEVEDWE